MEPRVIKGQVVRDASMKRYTSMRVGGHVPYLFYPEDEEDVTAVLMWLRDRDLSFRFLGNGTNVVVADEGMSIGVVRVTRMKLLRFTRRAGGAMVEASAGLPSRPSSGKAPSGASRDSENLYGIPGTIGGAIKMNAGSFAASVSDCLKSVRLANRNGTVVSLEKKEMEFGYRTSFVGAGQCILSAVFEMTDRDPALIKADMEKVWHERLEKHPMDLPSAGSVFRNKNGSAAWKNIDEAGLRGFTLGGAQVSEKHPNFIVNIGHATASDIKGLIEAVKKRVLESTGVALEEEVEMWGF